MEEVEEEYVGNHPWLYVCIQTLLQNDQKVIQTEAAKPEKQTC